MSFIILLLVLCLFFFRPSKGLLPPSFSNETLFCSNPPEGFSMLEEGSLILFASPPLKPLGKRSYEGDLNTNMNLTCVTRGTPHDWVAPSESLQSISFYSSEDIHAFIQTLHHVYNRSIDFKDVNGLHLSTLRLPKLKNVHVGFYECRPQGHTLRKRNSFYISVKDDARPSALTAPLTYTSAEEGSNAYIPCRPSHRNILVRMERRENPRVSLFRDLPFNFKRGFLLRNVSIDEDDGTYRCIFTSPRVRDVFRDVRLSVIPAQSNSTTSDGNLYVASRLLLCIAFLSSR